MRPVDPRGARRGRSSSRRAGAAAAVPSTRAPPQVMLAWDVCPGEETIAAYVAGQLPRDERDVIDSHLDACSACQELVATLAKVEREAPAPDNRITADAPSL